MDDAAFKIEERFWSKVEKRGSDDCWEWKAYKNPKGYGEFRLGRNEKAHRVSFFLARGYWPEKHICHSCDNPGCVNPCHLWEGSNAENHIDKVHKGRQARGEILSKTRRGEKNNLAKLTTHQVKEIRKIYESGDVTQRTLAKDYGVDHTNISCIVNGKTWNWLK